MKVFEISITWKSVYERIPLEDTPEAEERRSKLFEKFDVDIKGRLTLEQLDAGIRKELNLDGAIRTKPIIMKAFAYTKENSPVKL